MHGARGLRNARHHNLFYKIVTSYLTPRKQLGASSSIVCDSQGGHPHLSSNSAYEVWQGAEFWRRSEKVMS